MARNRIYDMARAKAADMGGAAARDREPYRQGR